MVAFTRFAITVPMSEAEIFTALQARARLGHPRCPEATPPGDEPRPHHCKGLESHYGACSLEGGEGMQSQGTHLATSLKVFFLVMPAPFAALPFQGSGCKKVMGWGRGGAWEKS